MKALYRKWMTGFELIDSVIGVVGVLFILGSALFIQLHYGEQPCPLCLLQRVCFANIGLAMLLNIRYHNRVWHWAMAIVSACAGAAVSLRQISLHVTSPAGFGSQVLGLHMYSWCFLFFVFCIVASAIMLLIYPEKR